MIPFILTLAAAVVITPGGVPVVADHVHPNETVWIQQIKDARPEPELIVLATQASPFPTYPMPDFGTDYYPQETVDAILAAHFPTEAGLAWAYRVGNCESGFRLTALGAVGEISWFQHRPLEVGWLSRRGHLEPRNQHGRRSVHVLLTRLRPLTLELQMIETDGRDIGLGCLLIVISAIISVAAIWLLVAWAF